jgi:hypothetical protein
MRLAWPVFLGGTAAWHGAHRSEKRWFSSATSLRSRTALLRQRRRRKDGVGKFPARSTASGFSGLATAIWYRETAIGLICNAPDIHADRICWSVESGGRRKRIWLRVRATASGKKSSETNFPVAMNNQLISSTTTCGAFVNDSRANSGLMRVVR